MKNNGLACLSIALLVGANSVCSATTFTVLNLNDSGAGSLRQAILSAANGDNIVFNDGLSGTIALTSGVLTITNSIRILGPGPQVLSVSGNGSSGVFSIPLILGAHPVFNVALSGLTITNGQATSAQQYGGGIFNYGTLTVSNCVISGNKTAPCNVITCFSGGGIANLSVCTIINSTISQNEASGNGGGIFTSAAGLSLVNCTICSNIADADYGAIFGFPVFMTNCTVAGNQAAVSVGGMVSSTSSSNVLANSTVAGNTAGGFPSDVSGPFISAGYNFIGVTNGSTGFGLPGSEDLTGSTASPIDPSLGPLQLNGGQTPTMAPLPGSPVIDQGKSFGIASDQRGRSRPFDFSYLNNAVGGDGSDIGAYEVNPSSLVVSNNNDSGPGSLRQALQDAGGSDSDSVTFASNVTGVITLTNGLLVVGKTLEISGPGASVLALSGNNGSRIFEITGFESNVHISDLSLMQARSGDGGVLVTTDSSLDLRYCTISGNACAGVYDQGGIVDILYSTIAGNASAGHGGGVVNVGGDLVIQDSTLSGNIAALGGGIYLDDGSLELDNCTIVSNQTTAAGVPSRQGGGIYVFAPGPLPPVVRSTIIANNSANQGPDVLGAFNSAGYNLIGVGDGSAGFTNGINQDQVGSAGTPLDPLLGPLQNNGGPTPTHAPLSGSPVVDQGFNSFGLANDQRGLPRTVDIACVTNAVGGDGRDIGAVEVGAPPVCSDCSTQVLVDISRTLRTADARWFGINAAIWDSQFDTTDTLSALTEMGCRVLRFPGGSASDDYHWATGFSGSSTFQWPTGYTNFAHIATNLGAQVFITVNYGSGTTNEAANWVRSANITNHCGFKYWEVGNECYYGNETDYNTNSPYMPMTPGLTPCGSGIIIPQ